MATATATTAPPPPRRSRPCRATRVERMRDEIAALERAVPVLLTLGGARAVAEAEKDDDAQWDGFLEPEAMSVRRLMRRSLQLTKEARALQSTQWQLQRLLREHRVASRVLAGILHKPNPVDDWGRDVHRWRELVRRLYTPRTMAQCQPVIAHALAEIDAFQWYKDKLTTGMSFLGWRDLQRVDAARGEFHFQFRKTFQGFDVLDYTTLGWESYTDPSMFARVMLGPHARVEHDGIIKGPRTTTFFEVLQHLGPNVVIIQSSRRIDAIDLVAHIVGIVFRAKTARGFMQCMWPIACPELMEAINEPRDMWATNAVWSQWEWLEEASSDNAFEMRVGGRFAGRDVRYAREWMLETFACVLRSEMLATGRQLITCD